MNLKGTVVVCLTALFMLTTVNESKAQDQRVRVGLKFSGNMSWIAPSTKNILREGTGLGTSYGIMADYSFQEFYSLSSELIFTTMAGSIKHRDLLYHTSATGGKQSFQNVGYDYNFKYIQIPVSLKFKTKEMGYITYWAQFGLAPSFLIEAKADITGRTPFTDPTELRVNKSENDTYEFDNFDDDVFPLRMPLIIGAGIEYSLAGNTSLYTGVRMDNNFLTIFNADKNTSAKNNYVSLAVGMFF